MSNSAELIKRCPACGEESPPSELRCACGTLLAHVDLTAPGGAQRPTVEATLPAAETASVLCPHPDCTQPNAPGARCCLYCNRPLGNAPAARIHWPWGESTPIGEELIVGRVQGADASLVERLGKEFDNVSRRHAVLRAGEGGITVEDLGSSNGTFVNEIRLRPHQPVRLHDGACVRFAADLVATVRIEHD